MSGFFSWSDPSSISEQERMEMEQQLAALEHRRNTLNQREDILLAMIQKILGEVTNLTERIDALRKRMK